MNSGKQFSISFKEIVKKQFGDKGDFGNFYREHENTDPLGASLLVFQVAFVHRALRY